MELVLGRRRGGPIAALAIALLFFFTGLAYLAGVLETLGYEERHVSFSGLASGTKSGGGFGLKRMLFFEGQTFFAAYEAEVREGSLRIGILDTFGPIGNKPHFVEAITETSSGEATYRIPKTGLYSIYFDGSVLGNSASGGYDVTYSIRWGAR